MIFSGLVIFQLLQVPVTVALPTEVSKTHGDVSGCGAGLEVNLSRL